MHSLTRISILIALLLGAAIGAQAQSSSSGPTAGSSISGRVTLGGNPAPGLMIGAQRNDANASSSPSEPAAKATTDQDGRYEISGLAPGRYRVTSLSTVYVVPGETQITPLSGKTITLNENDRAENIDFSVVRGAVITGKVTDAEGRALIGERVTLTAIDERGGKRPLSSFDFMMNEIDDRGVYRIFGLPAGRYSISAGQVTDGSSIRYAGPTYRRTFHPNAIEEEQAKIIELREGQEASNVDIAMGRPVKTFEAYGRIISAETGQPLPNVMFGYGGLREGTSRPTSMGSSGTPTNVRGEFRIDNLLPGRYAAFLYNFPGLSVSDAASDYYSAPVPFEISDGNISGIEIRVHRAGSVTGVIAAEDGNDQALLSQAAQAFVFGMPVQSGPTTLTAPMAITSPSSNRIQPNGSFRVSGLSPGKMRLSLNAPGLQVVRIEREGTPLSDGLIEIGPGEQISGLRLIVSYGNGVVRGEVKVTGGTPVPGTRLMVSARRLNSATPGMPPPVSSAEADARGRFLLERLAPGEYELTARLIASPEMMRVTTTTTTGGGSTTIVSGGGAPGGTSVGPPPPMPTVKQNVTVANGTEAQVTLTLDLSGKK